MKYKTKQREVDIYEFTSETIPEITKAVYEAGFSFNHGVEPEGLWAEVWCDGYWQNTSEGEYIIVSDDEVIVADKFYVDDVYEPVEGTQSLGGPLQGTWTT